MNTQKKPVTVYLAPEDIAEASAAVSRYEGLSRHAILAASIRLGLGLLKEDPQLAVEMSHEAAQARVRVREP